jgi:HAD superfamily phosphoserine phosphatase-like hydrolase
MIKKLALFDWDGTLRRGFTIKSWIRFLVEQKFFASDVEDKLLSFFNAYNHGKLNHDELSKATAELYASALKNFRKEDILLAASNFLSEDKTLLNPFSIPLISFLKARDIGIAVISGAPTEVIQAYQGKLKIDEVFALECEIKDGIYSGNIKVNTGTSTEKSKVISHLVATQKYSFYLAMGNSNSDIPIFKAAPIKAVVNNPDLASRIYSDSHPSSKVISLEENSEVSTIIDFLMRGT